MKRVRAHGTFTAARPRSATTAGVAKAGHAATRSKGSSVASQATASARRKKLQALEQEERDLAAALAAHNRKFKAKTKYEPTMHGVRDVRKV